MTALIQVGLQITLTLLGVLIGWYATEQRYTRRFHAALEQLEPGTPGFCAGMRVLDIWATGAVRASTREAEQRELARQLVRPRSAKPTMEQPSGTLH